MTIGPAPMIRIDLMSVRLGMGLGRDFRMLGAQRCARRKKRPRSCASFDGVESQRKSQLGPSLARALCRPESRNGKGPPAGEMPKESLGNSGEMLRKQR